MEYGFKGTRKEVLNNICILSAVIAYDMGISPRDYFMEHLTDLD